MGSMYGYEIRSEAPLERLRDEPGPRGTIRVLPGSDLLALRGELVGYDAGPGLAPLAVARTDRGLVAVCGATGAFRVDPGAMTITYEPEAADAWAETWPGAGGGPAATPRSGASASTRAWWEHRLGTLAVPMLAAERGDLVVHASVVVASGRAVLFCGPARRGKSTLALLLARRGYPVLAEDGCVIEPTGGEKLAWPGPRGVRVAPASAAAAGIEAAGERRAVQRLEPDEEASRPTPVGAVVVLEERGTELRLEPLGHAEALAALVPYLIHRGGVAGLRPAFAAAARLVSGARCLRASLPDDLERAAESGEQLVAAALASPRVTTGAAV